MINLSTKDEALLKELELGYPKAIYWFKKQFGGDKGYEKMRDNLMRKVGVSSINGSKKGSSDVVEYIDPNGNRWRIFEFCEVSKNNFVNTNTYAFVYYETFGSCGAFIPQWHAADFDSKSMGCVIYTDHFFLRFCERLGIEYRSSAMIKNFIEVIPFQVFSMLDSYRGGKQEVVGHLPSSQANGVLRYNKNGHHVLQMNTYKTDIMLSNKQRRETEPLRQAGKYEFTPLSEKKAMAELADKRGEFDKFIDKELDNLSHVGIDKEIMKDALSMIMLCVDSFVNLGWIVADDEKTISNFCSGIREKAYDSAYGKKNKDKYPDVNAFAELVLVAKYGAKVIGSRKFDLNTFAKYALKTYWKITPEDGDYTATIEEYENKIKKYIKSIKK